MEVEEHVAVCVWWGGGPSGPLSAAQQDDDVDEQQADEDEGEVDEELLQVPLGLWVHLDLRRAADGWLGHVLNALHGDGDKGLLESERRHVSQPVVGAEGRSNGC